MSFDISAEGDSSRQNLSITIAVALAVIGMALTGFAVERAHERDVFEQTSAITAELRSGLTRVGDAFDHYQSTLRITSAVTGMMGTPTADQWFGMSHSMETGRRMPGLAAIGYAQVTIADDRVIGARVERIEVLDAKLALVTGDDLSRDARLVNVMQRAVETGVPAVSVPLDRCLADEPCLALAMPAFLGGVEPASPEQRIELANGVVFAFVNPGETVRAAFGSETRARSLSAFDGASGGIASARLFAFGDPDATGLTVSDLVTVGNRQWTLIATDASRSGGFWSGRVALVLASGMALTLLIVMLSGYQALLRRRAEQTAERMTRTVRESERRFRQLSEMSAEWFWETGPDHRFTRVTDGIRVTGVDAAHMLGRTRMEIACGWSDNQKSEHQALLDSRQIIRRLEYDTRTADGAARRFMISGDPVFDEQGRFSGYHGVGKDVTESRRLARELRESHDTLARTVDERTAALRKALAIAEAANLSKSEFLANMSHELRTPLHAMMSFSKIGLTKALTAPPERLQGYFEKIHAAGGRLLLLVNDLLDLSKLEAGRMLIERSSCDLNALLRDVCEELDPLLVGGSLRFALPPAHEVFVAEIDRMRMTQVLRNLLSNAIKFSRPGRSIQVTVVAASMPMADPGRGEDGARPAWRLTVLDEGIGIPEQEMDSIFDKFVQSSKTKTGAGGTGLGLSITREIVNAHQGHIRAYNRMSGGAAFEVLLPQRGTPPTDTQTRDTHQ